jgi:hypothetical protein
MRRSRSMIRLISELRCLASAVMLSQPPIRLNISGINEKPQKTHLKTRSGPPFLAIHSSLVRNAIQSCARASLATLASGTRI